MARERGPRYGKSPAATRLGVLHRVRRDVLPRRTQAGLPRQLGRQACHPRPGRGGGNRLWRPVRPMSPYGKALASLVGVVITVLAQRYGGQWWFYMIPAAATALGVYAVPNTAAAAA